MIETKRKRRRGVRKAVARAGEPRTPAVILAEFHSAADAPVDGGPATASDRFLAADWRARSRSTDPDARAARILAAELNFIADELEAGPESSLGTIASKPATERAAYLADRRALVRKVRHAAARSDRDEWVALAGLVASIERLADSLRDSPEPHYAPPRGCGCPCQACFLARQVPHVIAELRANLPLVGDRMTEALVSKAVLASVAPRRGASKWEAFGPIAKILVNVSDAEEIRKELGRLRARRRKKAV